MSSQKIELNEDTEITLNYTDILSIFGSLDLIKSYRIPPIEKLAKEIEVVIEEQAKKSINPTK